MNDLKSQAPTLFGSVIRNPPPVGIVEFAGGSLGWMERSILGTGVTFYASIQVCRSIKVYRIYPEFLIC